MRFLIFPLLLAGHVISQSASTSFGVPIPSAQPLPNSLRSQGCWAAQGNWTKQSPLSFLSSGSCGTACAKQNFTVSALLGGDCYCGNEYPPPGTSVDIIKCNYPCPGYDLEACGGLGPPPYYSVFNTGVEVVVPYKEVLTTSSSSTPSPVFSIFQSPPRSVTSTQPPVSSSPSSSGSLSSVGITVGVVVAVVIVLAVVGGGCVFWRRRQREQELEEERRRAAAVDAFVGSGKPSSFSTSPSINDSRLDPTLAHRRISDGSIADNQDYSRKILRVTNA